MLVLSYLFALLFVVSPVVDDRDVSLRVQRAVSPVPPGRTLATGLVVVEIEINQTTGALQTCALYGEWTFVSSALDALKHWRFVAPPDVIRSRTSITFLFRPPAFYSVKVPAVAIRPWMSGEDTSALPQNVIDPDYPAESEASGAVILEVFVNAEGSVTAMEVISGVADLTGQAKSAVKNWKFSPAMVSGKPVSSTAVVVISFRPPL